MLHSASGKTLFSGHRGSGADGSFDDQSILENCILSFSHAAAASHLNFVELDVQLSADGVPVVYHDWTVRVDALGAGLRSVALRVPIGHMDAAQLQCLAQLPSRCSRGLSNGAQRVYSELQWARGNKNDDTPVLRKCEQHVDDRVLLHSMAAR